MRNIQYLTIDINKKSQQDITANEGEVGSRFLKIKIIDNNVPVDLNNSEVFLYALKPDNTKVFNATEIVDATQGIVLAELTSQLLNASGIVKLTLVLTEGANKLISKEFSLKVDDSIFDDSAIESTNEFTALTTALGQVQNIDNRFNEVNAQFNTMVRKNDTGVLNINVFDESTRKAILENSNIDINYVLGDRNVKINNLDKNIQDKISSLNSIKLDTINLFDISKNNLIDIMDSSKELTLYNFPEGNPDVGLKDGKLYFASYLKTYAKIENYTFNFFNYGTIIRFIGGVQPKLNTKRDILNIMGTTSPYKGVSIGTNALGQLDIKANYSSTNKIVATIDGLLLEKSNKIDIKIELYNDLIRISNFEVVVLEQKLDNEIIDESYNISLGSASDNNSNFGYGYVEYLEIIKGRQKEIGNFNELKTNEKNNLIGAINEVFTSVSDGKMMIASAITDKGIDTSYTDTFEIMSNNIRELGEIVSDNNFNDSYFTENLFNKDWQYSNDDLIYETISVPHCYNVDDATVKPYFRGEKYYKKVFSISDLNKKYFIKFDAINLKSNIYINDVLVKTHKGGYTSFIVDISENLKIGENTIKVICDNSFDKNIAPLTGDFTFGGGITRNCYLYEKDNEHFDFYDYGVKRIKISQISLNDNEGIINLKTKINNGSLDLKINYIITFKDKEINNITENYTGEYIDKNITINNPIKWNGVKNPALYNIKINLIKNDEIVDSIVENIGLRTFELTKQGFYLNGELYQLNGVNRHAENQINSYALTFEDENKDIDLILEMGCNAIRTSHYPQSDYFMTLCDKYGIIVFTEIPWVNMYPSSSTEEYDNNIMEQLVEMINNHYNHPSIAVWNLSNEVYNGGWNITMPEGSDTSFDATKAKLLNDKLYNKAKELDSSRFVGFVKHTNDLAQSLSDYNAWNYYYGWYRNMNDYNDIGIWLDSKKEYESFIFSEYGAGGNPNQHIDNPKLYTINPNGSEHPENYQSYVHEEHLKALSTRNWVNGIFVWCMFDFAHGYRNEGGHEGINDKGLVTRDREVKKDSFYLYKSKWNKEPMVHICSKRYQNRTLSSVNNIKVYSNCDNITLYVNGLKINTLDRTVAGANVIFEFDSISNLKVGENIIRATGFKNGEYINDSYTLILTN